MSDPTPIFVSAVSEAAKTLGHDLSGEAARALAIQLRDQKAMGFWATYADRVDPSLLVSDLRSVLAAPEGAQAAKAVGDASTAGLPRDVWDALSATERLARYRAYQTANGAAPNAKKRAPVTAMQAELRGHRLILAGLSGDRRAIAAREIERLERAIAEASR